MSEVQWNDNEGLPVGAEMNAKQSHYGHPAPSWPVPGMGSVQFKAKQAGDGSMSEDEVAPASPRVVEITPTSDGVFQAGGHGRLSKDPSNEGVIRKVANEAEIIFYQTLNGDDPLLHAIPDYIRSFFPRFHGVFDRKFIQLQDLTHGTSKCCVMDIKMGTKTYTTDSNFLKQWLLESKDSKTTTQALGFRVTGFRSYKKISGDYDVKGKPWGMALTPADISDNLATFFNDGECLRLDVLNKYIERLEVLLPWYSQQNLIKIYSSSLLFVYDSEGDVGAATVHMIDFAHVQKIETPEDRDYGYIAGLKNLIDLFKQIRDAHTPKPSASPTPVVHTADKAHSSSSSEKSKRKSRPAAHRDSPSPEPADTSSEVKPKTPSKSKLGPPTTEIDGPSSPPPSQATSPAADRQHPKTKSHKKQSSASGSM